MRTHADLRFLNHVRIRPRRGRCFLRSNLRATVIILRSRRQARLTLGGLDCFDGITTYSGRSDCNRRFTCTPPSSIDIDRSQHMQTSPPTFYVSLYVSLTRPSVVPGGVSRALKAKRSDWS